MLTDVVIVYKRITVAGTFLDLTKRLRVAFLNYYIPLYAQRGSHAFLGIMSFKKLLRSNSSWQYLLEVLVHNIIHRHTSCALTYMTSNVFAGEICA